MFDVRELTNYMPLEISVTNCQSLQSEFFMNSNIHLGMDFLFISNI
jgi:hypothetical protein